MLSIRVYLYLVYKKVISQYCEVIGCLIHAKKTKKNIWMESAPSRHMFDQSKNKTKGTQTNVYISKLTVWCVWFVLHWPVLQVTFNLWFHLIITVSVLMSRWWIASHKRRFITRNKGTAQIRGGRCVKRKPAVATNGLMILLLYVVCTEIMMISAWKTRYYC